jgi:hypothetical protein
MGTGTLGATHGIRGFSPCLLSSLSHRWKALAGASVSICLRGIATINCASASPIVRAFEFGLASNNCCFFKPQQLAVETAVTINVAVATFIVR